MDAAVAADADAFIDDRLDELVQLTRDLVGFDTVSVDLAPGSEHRTNQEGELQAYVGGVLGDFERSWFYSDSASDLPLLEAVSDPVAVRPDERLRARARQHGWMLID